MLRQPPHSPFKLHPPPGPTTHFQALIVEQRRFELTAQAKNLTSQKRDLQAQVDQLRATIASTKAKAQERQEGDEKSHQDDVERVMRTNEQMKSSLENLLSAPKK